MPYTQRYNAKYVKPLIEQAIAIIQRDQAAAIPLVNASLAQIAEFHKGPVTPVASPWMYLSGGAIEFDQSSWDSRHYRARIQLALYNPHMDPELGQDLIFDYGRLVDMILTTAGPPPSLADWTTPLSFTWPPGGASQLTGPPAAGTVKEVFVESHDYGLVRVEGIDVPLWRVLVTVLFEMEET